MAECFQSIVKNTWLLPRYTKIVDNTLMSLMSTLNRVAPLFQYFLEFSSILRSHLNIKWWASIKNSLLGTEKHCYFHSFHINFHKVRLELKI